MNIWVVTLIGSILTGLYFEFYKSHHERIYDAEKPVHYGQAGLWAIPVFLLLGLAFLGGYFLYKKIFF